MAVDYLQKDQNMNHIITEIVSISSFKRIYSAKHSVYELRIRWRILINVLLTSRSCEAIASDGFVFVEPFHSDLITLIEQILFRLESGRLPVAVKNFLLNCLSIWILLKSGLIDSHIFISSSINQIRK